MSEFNMCVQPWHLSNDLSHLDFMIRMKCVSFVSSIVFKNVTRKFVRDLIENKINKPQEITHEKTYAIRGDYHTELHYIPAELYDVPGEYGHNSLTIPNELADKLYNILLDQMDKYGIDLE